MGVNVGVDGGGGVLVGNGGGVSVGVACATAWLVKATNTKPANVGYNQYPVSPGRGQLLRRSISPLLPRFPSLGLLETTAPFYTLDNAKTSN